MINIRSLAALLSAVALSACGGDAARTIAAPATGADIKFFNFGVGAPGVNFFSSLSPTVIASTTNATSGGAPAETVTATFSDATKLQASDYRLQVVSGKYQLTRLSDGQQTTLSSLPGTAATVDGITISVERKVPASKPG